ncbi:thiamine biosynthesis lipoprotein [Catenulispora sp. GAS73]|uniref:FAD:protein FMN transferase n=1 Tax=Catenulispora sp. GAS73 TaxID=3156269 RepID=UPI003516764D
MTVSTVSTVWVGARPIGKAAFPIWGGTAELLLTEAAAIDGGERLLAAELAAVGAACSRFRGDSELSAVNAGGGAPVVVSSLFLEFLDVALAAAVNTGGAVDPTCGSALVALGYDCDYSLVRERDARRVPGSGRHRAPDPSAAASVTASLLSAVELDPAPAAFRPVAGWRAVEVDAERGSVRVPDGVVLDFGATAKAHAADRAARLIAAELGCGALVNLSGDISIAGPAPEGGWSVRVADGEAIGPEDPGQTIAVYDGGLATSGTTVRTWQHGSRTVHHIIDPETGDAASIHWQTVSALAATCVAANTLTTAAIVRGADLVPWLSETGCPVRMVGIDGTITLLGGWPEEETAR